MTPSKTGRTDLSPPTIGRAHFQRSLARPRTLISLLLTLVTVVVTLLALFPLFSVVIMLVYRGGGNFIQDGGFNFSIFWQLPPAPLDDAIGGFGNALVGTLAMVTIASAIAIPLGILGAIFLSEIGPETRLGTTLRFCARTLTGFPSILAGVFAYGAVKMLLGTFSAYAGGAALSLLMLPTVMLTAEEAIRMVPQKIKEAAIGMGATQTQTVWRVLLPTAFPGILTGVMLAVARAAGETAPLLFTARFSDHYFTRTWNVAQWPADLNQQTASLPVLIYNFYGNGIANQEAMAWSAALVLVLMVLSINLLGQAFSKRDRY